MPGTSPAKIGILRVIWSSFIISLITGLIALLKERIRHRRGSYPSHNDIGIWILLQRIMICNSKYSLLFKLGFGLTTYVPTWPIEGFKGSNFWECRNEVLVFIMFLLKEIKWKILNCFRRNIKSFFELKELCFLWFVYNHKNAKLFLTFSVLLLIRFAFSHLKFARLNKK